MSNSAVPAEYLVGVKPPDAREWTWRAVICAMGVAALMGAAYPYTVMKLGFGPNVSVVAAFLGYLALGIIFRNFNRWENNIVQTAGTAGAQTAFMCVLLAAFDMLALRPELGFHLTLTPMQSFAWLTAAGLLGVFLAVPMRQHFVVDEQLTYADGVATGETLIVLDGRGQEARSAARSLGLGTLASAGLYLFQFFKKVPELLFLGATGQNMSMGVSWSLLSLGSGMIVGMRINTSMLVGTLLSWVVAPYLLIRWGVLEGEVGKLKKFDVLRWVMWPATGMLVAGGLTALALRWRVLVKTFRSLSGNAVSGKEFPMRWVVVGALLSGVALVVVQKVSLGMPVWMTLVAILLSVPLMLVGLRVLGETNWGPISALSNMMQGIFGALAPGNIAANMVASGTTGTVAVESEALMQDFKAGHMIGSTPRFLTYAQLMAVPVGALAVSYMYPTLKRIYGIGGDHGLSSPISQKWAGFAELLSKGFAALPAHALEALMAFTLLGIVLSVLETRWKKFTPSSTGIGIGMLVPGVYVVTMFLGGVVDWAWTKLHRRSAEAHMIPLASGLIAGEAIIVVGLALLIGFGLVTPPAE